MEYRQINQEIQNLPEKEQGTITDGYHTFDELYHHRVVLFITLCRLIFSHNTIMPIAPIWRSKLHSDGTMYNGWFVMGIGKEKGNQVTYHIPMTEWDLTGFADTLDNAPEWDGHTPEDVLKRLLDINLRSGA